MIYKLELTDEEKRRVDKFAAEANNAANQIEALFTRNTHDMMKFLLALRILQVRYPSSVSAEIYERVAEWIATGEPEDLTSIADKILERCRG